EVPMDIVDDIVLVDDKSPDNTVEVAKNLGINHIVVHEVNKGYGGNQKSCYAKALELNADIVVMLHPDYQYTPKLIHAMAGVIAYDVYPVCFGSRILGKGALKGGMPMYKYIANRFLTLFENIMIGQKLSEYHTGYRAFTAEVIRSIDFTHNSDDFVFDNEMISQIFMNGYEIGEVTCPTKYFDEASSINFSRSMKYGRGVLRVSLIHLLHKAGLIKSKLYRK
ncbi:MAG TPA: glycosyltransferase family 2 protein, partial [Flavipsychrobacter sp.]|nr:glycosyltransferase family 2 protein [Flavipsychrobacter sp.]